MKFTIPPQPWDGLNEFALADILHMMPDSLGDVVLKRIRLLREAGHDEFAAFVETRYADYITPAAINKQLAAQAKFVRRLEALLAKEEA
jgi:hypothetical protein